MKTSKFTLSILSFLISSIAFGYNFITPQNTNSNGCRLEYMYIPDGSSITAYQNRYETNGNRCMSETRFCHNGQLTGSYPYISCEVLSRR